MKQILIRLALTLPVVWLVVSLVFLLIHLVPGDPFCRCWARARLPADIERIAPSIRSRPAAVDAVRALLERGASRRSGQFDSAARNGGSPDCCARYPYTLALALTALGVGAGAGAACRDSGCGAAGTLVGSGAFSGQPFRLVGSQPGIWGRCLSSSFSILLGWLPVSGSEQRRRARRHRLGISCAAVGGHGSFAGGDSDAHGAYRRCWKNWVRTTFGRRGPRG